MREYARFVRVDLHGLPGAKHICPNKWESQGMTELVATQERD